MGGFLKYLDKMETDFNSDEKKEEKYIEQIDESETEYCVEEDEQDIGESESVDISIYKKRMVNELFNLGLNKNKINDVVQNVFSDDGDVMVEYDEPQRRRAPQPQRQLSFKERMQKMKRQQQGRYQQQPQRQQPPAYDSFADKASDILAGVPIDDPYAAPSEMGGMYGGGMYPSQQQMAPQMRPQQQYYGQQSPTPNYNRPIGNQMPMIPLQQPMPQGPPPVPAQSMSTINDANVGSVAVAPQQPMLKMPEGYENFKIEGEKIGESKNIPVQTQMQVAAGILDEPRGGSVCAKPARIGEVKQGEVHNVNFQPQQEQAPAAQNANAILEAPVGPPPAAPQMGAMGGTADHASQLL